ncbi:hypothetical protein BGX21_008933 [Mortierella sp. AD011]|nr:hypothetical protein BGX21_008933 [Mortierella sp. AD011]
MVGIKGLTTTLAEEMLGMPNLDKIRIGTGHYAYNDFTNKGFGTILSSSRKGWRVIEMQSYFPFDKVSKRALFKHLPTLEDLLISGDHGFSSDDLARILKTSSHLRSISTFDGRDWDHGHIIGRIEANTFIDMGPIINSLKPWPCENSLRVLIVKIANIPNPNRDDRHGVGTTEQYPGQGRASQLWIPLPFSQCIQDKDPERRAMIKQKYILFYLSLVINCVLGHSS